MNMLLTKMYFGKYLKEKYQIIKAKPTDIFLT